MCWHMYTCQHSLKINCQRYQFSPKQSILASIHQIHMVPSSGVGRGYQSTLPCSPIPQEELRGSAMYRSLLLSTKKKKKKKKVLYDKFNCFSLLNFVQLWISTYKMVQWYHYDSTGHRQDPSHPIFFWTGNFICLFEMAKKLLYKPS